MACSGCQKKRMAKQARSITKDGDLMGGYKYLSDKQIKTRLEAYKRRFCATCNERYNCSYDTYLKCEIRLK